MVVQVVRVQHLGVTQARLRTAAAKMRGAGDRDRTGMTSLEGWGSAIELRPRGGLAAPASVPFRGAAGTARGGPRGESLAGGGPG
jgi:hypothetical protein